MASRSKVHGERPRRERSQPTRLDDNAMSTPPGVPSRIGKKKSSPQLRKKRTKSLSRKVAMKAPRKSTGRKGPRKGVRASPNKKTPSATRTVTPDALERNSAPNTPTRRYPQDFTSSSPTRLHNVAPDLHRFETDTGFAEENVEQIDGQTVLVTIKRKCRTAVPCPSKDEKCTVLVRVGKYGRNGDGKAGCQHCGQGSNKSTRNNVAELTRHVSTAACREKQGLPKTIRKTPKQILGRHRCHEIDAVENFFEEGRGTGPAKHRFRCPNCEKEMNWSERFSHCVRCDKTI